MLILLLHAVLKPRGYITQKGSKRRQKPTIADSQHRMFISVDKKEDATSCIRSVIETFKTAEKPMTPFVLSIAQSYYEVVISEDVRFQFALFKEALCACFQIICILLKEQYPIECETVWYFIQRYLYEIKTSNETIFFNRCADLFDFLKEKEISNNN